MKPPSVRVLRLLGVLQSRREWPGKELGERLEVDVRTLRRDVERLRDLGYVITSSSGPGGGYRLGAGSTTPPLLLDDDEAVAVAMALAASAGSVSDVEDVALRVLAKLTRVMPPRVRRKVGVMLDVTSLLPGARVTVDFRVLATLASACLDALELRFSYEDARGALSSRTVEPLRLVHTGRLWYLAARDVDRDDLRTFRVDRVRSANLAKDARRFVTELSDADITAFVARAVSTSPYRFHARFRLEGSVSSLRPRIPSWLGVLEAESSTHSVLTLGGDSLEGLVALAGHVGLDFELLEPRELAQPLERAAQRLVCGARSGRDRVSAPPV
ncbi:MAG: WYL domain-containing protein [Deltaproteobacteria bacterium]|nr:WYL domain-containing protein [Nannocystaceae bacterium]